MTGYRTKPKTGTTQLREQIPYPGHDQPGCALMLLGPVISYVVLSAIMDVLSNSATQMDKVICYGSLVFFMALTLLGIRDMHRDSKVRKAEMGEWKASCTVAQLEIMNRHPGGSFEGGYGRFHSCPYGLELKANADQRAVSSNITTVSVSVSGHIYDQLAGCDAVRIYYLPEAPLAFLLEEET